MATDGPQHGLSSGLCRVTLTAHGASVTFPLNSRGSRGPDPRSDLSGQIYLGHRFGEGRGHAVAVSGWPGLRAAGAHWLWLPLGLAASLLTPAGLDHRARAGEPAWR